MKKYIPILIMGLLFPIRLLSQNFDTPPDSVKPIWEMESEAWHDWNRIDSIWNDSIYRPTLKKHHLKMNCSNCEYILMHVDFKIDSAGLMEAYRVTKSNICGKEAEKDFEEELMKFFSTYIFPVTLRSKEFRVILGTGLKC